MPPVTEEKLRRLRDTYRVTYTAYMRRVDALTALISKRERAPAELMENEAKALRELHQARGAYRDAQNSK
jgi:hypothetical protein